MPEFRLVPAPILAPGRCQGCGQSSGEMVDLMIRPDNPALSPYLCRMCVYEAARLVGWSPPDLVDGLLAEAAELGARVGELEGLLVWEREHKVVAVSDALRLADRMVATPIQGEDESVVRETGARQAWTEWYEASIESGGPALCTATRADGDPCTAEALPGRDVCLAHSKRRAAA